MIDCHRINVYIPLQPRLSDTGMVGNNFREELSMWNGLCESSGVYKWTDRHSGKLPWCCESEIARGTASRSVTGKFNMYGPGDMYASWKQHNIYSAKGLLCNHIRQNQFTSFISFKINTTAFVLIVCGMQLHSNSQTVASLKFGNG